MFQGLAVLDNICCKSDKKMMKAGLQLVTQMSGLSSLLNKCAKSLPEISPTVNLLMSSKQFAAARAEASASAAKISWSARKLKSWSESESQFELSGGGSSPPNSSHFASSSYCLFLSSSAALS